MVTAATLDESGLKADLAKVTTGFKGRVGICVQAQGKPVCHLGDQRFSIQSVMKLLVGIATLDAVDRQSLKIDTKIRIEKKDGSVFTQPIMDKVGAGGYEATIGELVRSANIFSDSAAADILLDRLGGPSAVQQVLERKGIRGVRIDRTERDLQSHVKGLTWKPEYADPKVLDTAIAAVPEARRDAAYLAYQRDPRDTSTPVGMADLLVKLAQGKLLSAASTKFLMGVLEETETGPDRLKAGVSGGWRLAHKTGTSGGWKGLNVATNDVGVLIAPDGTRIAIAVFVADSTEDDARRAAVIADAARAAIRRTKN